MLPPSPLCVETVGTLSMLVGGVFDVEAALRRDVSGIRLVVVALLIAVLIALVVVGGGPVRTRRTRACCFLFT